MGSIIIKALIKTLPWVMLGIILRLIYDKYYYSKKIRKEIEESMDMPNTLDEIKIVSFNNPKSIKESHNGYIGFFYNWSDLKRYINTNDPKKYLNKVFSIEINHKIHYYLIVSNYVIEEVTLSSDK